MTANTYTTPHPDQFNPYCGLYSLIMGAEPKELGFNHQTHKARRDATQDELDAIADRADCTLTTFSIGIRSIGLLILHTDKKEITNDAWSGLADLLVSLSEAQLALRDLQSACEEAEPAHNKKGGAPH